MSLALYWGIEVPEATLSDRAAEAAFIMAQVYTQGVPTLESPGEGEEEDNQDTEDVNMPWDEPQEELPTELKQVWTRAMGAGPKIDIKKLLESTPVYTGLPRKAPINNYRQHGNNFMDKTVRVWQQCVLHILRLQVKSYNDLKHGTSAASHMIFQAQLWQLLAQLYNQMSDHRREQSLPGCTTGYDGEELFGKEPGEECL
jgi:hypothetical protein